MHPGSFLEGVWWRDSVGCRILNYYWKASGSIARTLSESKVLRSLHFPALESSLRAAPSSGALLSAPFASVQWVLLAGARVPSSACWCCTGRSAGATCLIRSPPPVAGRRSAQALLSICLMLESPFNSPRTQLEPPLRRPRWRRSPMMLVDVREGVLVTQLCEGDTEHKRLEDDAILQPQASNKPL